jgi:hypothetical protein
MTNLLAGLSFGAPWILAALAVLPVIWFLLRVTPPMARRIVFPPVRLLLGLKDSEQTPARTPVWLLLLRSAAAALVIIALAEPMLGAAPQLAGKGPIVLFIDNGWTAAPNWDARLIAVADAARSAERSGRAIGIVSTADQATGSINLLDAGSTARTVRSLEPVPWLPSRGAATKRLQQTHFSTTPDFLWLSDGVDDGNARKTAASLSALGHLRIFADDVGKAPLALLPPVNEPDGFSVTVARGAAAGMREGEVAALGARDESLATAHFHFDDGRTTTTTKLVLPLEVRNETARLVVRTQDAAGSVQLMDQGAARRAVGIVSASDAESAQPLLSDVYYIERALAPYADVQKGTISGIVAHNPSVLVLADIGRIAGADHDRVAQFVGEGGVLIRFAGERMTNGIDDLIPVRLRTGGRYLGGALAWAKPQHLGAFGDSSPFDGLVLPGDVTISRQILAEPSVELSDRTWARLQDGTPLVTAEQRGKGWIVLFHVAASPTWSTLPLSGVFVGMLRRLLAISNGTKPKQLSNGASLPATETLDGFGHSRGPAADVLPIRASELGKTAVSRVHPPGLYGPAGAALALNAVSKDTVLVPLEPGRTTESYAGTNRIALTARLLASAMTLLLIDALIALWLRGHLDLGSRFGRNLAACALAAIIVHPGNAHADDAFDAKAALDTRLAYVATGLADVDQMSKAGLAGLGAALKARTSYEPEEPMGVDIARDDLSFFPLLYWPMDPREKDLAPQALSKIADYMRNGGTIVFDTRDLTLGSVRGAASPGEQTLRRLLAKLDVPPLQPVPGDHVLTKAFYLLNEFPGRWDGGKVWVEALPPRNPNAGPEPARGGDGVSPVIIGSDDWAAAWAVDSQGRPLVDIVPGGERQRELAIRFGVNLVMYALTGNYKTDQVHVPALLERLGK